MNNKPVAWMELYYGEPNNLSWTDAELRDSGEVYKTVPLYTHPAPELTEDAVALIRKFQDERDELKIECDRLYRIIELNGTLK